MGMKAEVVFTAWVVKCRCPNCGGPCTMEELWSRELPGLGKNLLSCVMWWLSLLFFFNRLKDDDSGDHDQNEENNTQKDSEKEKNDREKPQSTTKRKVWCWHLTPLPGHGVVVLGVNPQFRDKENMSCRAVVSVRCYCCSEDRGTMFDFSNLMALLEVFHLRDECSLH